MTKIMSEQLPAMRKLSTQVKKTNRGMFRYFANNPKKRWASRRKSGARVPALPQAPLLSPQDRQNHLIKLQYEFYSLWLFRINENLVFIFSENRSILAFQEKLGLTRKLVPSRKKLSLIWNRATKCRTMSRSNHVYSFVSYLNGEPIPKREFQPPIKQSRPALLRSSALFWTCVRAFHVIFRRRWTSERDKKWWWSKISSNWQVFSQAKIDRKRARLTK